MRRLLANKTCGFVFSRFKYDRKSVPKLDVISPNKGNPQQEGKMVGVRMDLNEGASPLIIQALVPLPRYHSGPWSCKELVKVIAGSRDIHQIER